MGTILGSRFLLSTVGAGSCHCERCGGDRAYRQLTGRRWLTLLFIPVFPLVKAPEHVQCTVCGTRYRLDLLALPTVAQMKAALPAGMHAAATAMLRAGDCRSMPARQRAVAAIRSAGLAGYDDAALETDLAEPAEPGDDLAGSLDLLAGQLVAHGKGWFLAEVVRIGLAGGPLTEQERATARKVAALLGMEAARARAVITRTEQGAPSG